LKVGQALSPANKTERSSASADLAPKTNVYSCFIY
jgi:hypothetical protein